jgi:hypothetical protein
MPDREKVIECLQKAKMVIETWVPMFEQYNTPAGIDDAIALLKELESKEARRVEERVQSCLKCEEYRMFHGTVLVSPVIREDGTRWREPFDLTGTWLYRPDVDTWYCTPDDGGMTKSWVPAILSNFRIHY